MNREYNSDEMMTIAASRALSNSDVCFVGIGAPSAACNIARMTHAPDITLIYESGTIGTAPNILPLFLNGVGKVLNFSSSVSERGCSSLSKKFSPFF